MPITTNTSALIVGAGLMGRWHAHALRRLRIPIAGVVDPDAGAARSLAARSGNCPTWVDLDDAVQTIPSRLAAHVCSPIQSHAAVARRLLRAGAHVLVEKPLAADAKITRTLLDLAEDSQRMLCPVHQFVFQECVLKVLRWLPDAGALRAVDYVATSAGAGSSGADAAEEIMADILPHPLSLLGRILRVELSTLDWTVAAATRGEFRAMTSSGGTTVGVLISMSGRPTQNTLRLVCEGGTFEVDLFHGFATRQSSVVSRVSKIFRPFSQAGKSFASAGTNLAGRAVRREPAYPGLRELCRLFHVAASRDGPSWPIPSEETMDVATTRDLLLNARSIGH